MKLGIKDTVGSRFSLDNKLFKSMGFLMPENVWWHRSALWSVVLALIISFRIHEETYVFFCGVCVMFFFFFSSLICQNTEPILLKHQCY